MSKKTTLNRGQMWLVQIIFWVAHWVPWRVTTYTVEWYDSDTDTYDAGLSEKKRTKLFNAVPRTRWEWRNSLAAWNWLHRLHWTGRWINTLDPWEDDPFDDDYPSIDDEEMA
jgi:hypothetical protein